MARLLTQCRHQANLAAYKIVHGQHIEATSSADLSDAVEWMFAAHW
jgi:hypothetical protein